MNGVLLSTAGAKAMDGEASAQWGLNSFALVEAAGRACAEAFIRAEGFNTQELAMRGQTKGLRFRAGLLIRSGVCAKNSSLVVLAGKGNNAADALVMLKALILNAYIEASACAVFAVQLPKDSAEDEKNPFSEAMLAVQKLGVPLTEWNAGSAAALANADVIIDGIAGTGLRGPLRGTALEMAEAVNALYREKNRPFIVSVDMPSGNFDGWQPEMPMAAAHATLAIEPQKLCLYTPSARPYAGTIIPVKGIFPSILTDRYREAELVQWENASVNIPPVSKTAYKYERGLVEIRAGSPGAAGAARLSALGAQAAGAGLVRLIVDSSLYPVVASGCSGIMVSVDTESGRFIPAAVLLGPGWGRGQDRMRQLETFLPLEEQGLPLILDADAVVLAKDIIFHGNVILTPHPGEFAEYTGLSKDAITGGLIPALRRYSAEKQAHILYKSHVLYAASPDGRIGVIDGMNPALAAGGSGDVLAGFCAAIAARWRAVAARQKPFDGYACMCAAASLLIRTAESDGIAGTFFDPAELARAAAGIAGDAWLKGIV